MAFQASSNHWTDVGFQISGGKIRHAIYGRSIELYTAYELQSAYRLLPLKSHTGLTYLEITQNHET